MLKKSGLVLLLAAIFVAGYLVGRGMMEHDPRGVAFYEGVLPGADCAGLRTELTLYNDGVFFLKETYLATRSGDLTHVSFGKWQKRALGGRDIIQLNYDKPQLIYNFLPVNSQQLRVIDKEGRDIECPFDQVLTRKKL